ncbi:hypothetical protein U9M48_017658 [Paspalum notatum var. saurae]|uniref:Uncharacterized protein n=1 Tax=Paspalum notatum var. saurae TaxID=547442 RepID=A0AAQ3TBV3_PASNO
MESDTERDGGPILSPAPNPSGHHQRPFPPVKSTAFKREERRKRKDRKRQERLADELARWDPLVAQPPRPAAVGSISPSRAQPDTPWPCDPPPPPDPAEANSWSWGPPAVPAPPQRTVEAAAAAVPLHPQAAAVRSCRAFFESQLEDDEEEDDDEGNAGRFFGELLGSDAALRDFYQAEREKGQFLCLVCEGSGARVGKRFAGCAALVQHAGSVARTTRRLAHRAFADAVGLLLGWGAGRTTPLLAGSGSDGVADQADNSQSVEMEVS